jgi:hypothetical protein
MTVAMTAMETTPSSEHAHCCSRAYIAAFSTVSHVQCPLEVELRLIPRPMRILLV